MKVILLDDVASGRTSRRGARRVRRIRAQLPHPQEARAQRQRGEPQEPGSHQEAAGREGRPRQGRRRGAPRVASRRISYEERRQASEEGKLFGSVTSQDIADFLERQGVKIERRRIHLDEPHQDAGRDHRADPTPRRRHRAAQGHDRPRVARRSACRIRRPRGSPVLGADVYSPTVHRSRIVVHRFAPVVPALSTARRLAAEISLTRARALGKIKPHALHV